MKKLRLDDLTVESFETALDGPARRGTVHARESQDEEGTFEATCYEEYGCMETGGSGAVCCPTEDRCSGAATCDFSCQWGWHDTCH